MERQQSEEGAPPPHRGSLVPLAGNYPYREMGRPRIAPTVVSKGQKSHRNYIEDPMGETHNPIIQKFNKIKSYSTISPLYKSNRA